MYIKSAFRIENPEVIRSVVRENPFGLLVTCANGEPVANHLPFMLVEEEGRDVLVAHMARANPQWMHFASKALVVFSGPHGYVSPAWYETSPHVPTWNYVSVHAYGSASLIQGEEAVEHLLAMLQVFDPALSETNPESGDPQLLRKKLAGLVAFRIPVERWEAKAKLNQNKLEADRLAIKSRYEASDRPDEREMAKFM